LFAFLIVTLLQSGPALAGAPRPTALRFEVTIAQGLDTGRGRDGRLLVVLGRPDAGEPRFSIGRTGMDASPILGRDVAGLAPGRTAVLDDHSAIFPIAGLGELRAGVYSVQALLHTNRDLNFPGAPGDLYSQVRRVRIDPAAGGTVAIELSRALPEESLPEDTGFIRYIKLRSERLTAFHGRPMYLRAGVILPRDFDREPGRRYPLRVHIGGYAARFTGVGERMGDGSEFRRVWMADDTPRMIFLQLDGAGPLGDPYQVNSATHGPYGDAVTRELIPHVERAFRGIGSGSARFTDGGSTGGWVALAQQVFYPDFFNGAWSFCADSVDFRSLQLVNIYEDRNAYVNAYGFERPAAREVSGEVRYTMRHECGLENVLGRGDSWAMSGQQWGAWNATYGPRGEDGRPVPLWDPATGVIDHRAAEHWKAYDLRRVLETDWARLGPKLQGKLHIWMGDADDFFLNNAMHRLGAFLERASPAYGSSIRFAAGQGHCWMGISEREIMRQMAARAGRAGSNDLNRSE
jgi:hypothetical protein